MPSGFWLDGSIPVVLLPSGQHGQDLLDLASEWTRQGMLSEAVWVRPEAVAVVEGAPPTIDAVVVGLDVRGELRTQQADLFAILANERVRLVRLIKVRSALPDQQADDIQDLVGDQVGRYVGLSMPLLNPAHSGATDRTELLRASLICAPTDFQLRDRVEWASRDASVLVVASPEDRSSPSAGDAFVRDNERFTGFVLMHLATIGGMWRGLPIGSLELFEREGSAAQSIWVPRVFVSGVLTDGLALRAAAEVLRDVVQGEGAVAAAGAQVTALGAAVIPPGSVPSYIDRMVSAAMRLDDAALDFRMPEFDPVPRRDEVSVGRQLAMFARFSLGKLARVPRWTRLWSHDHAARELNRTLQGDGGRRVVELKLDQRLDARDYQLLMAAARAQQLDENSRALASGVPGGAAHRSTPRLWGGLRQLAFGTLDGSAELSQFGFERVDGRIPLFGTVAAVVPDPDDVWVHPGPVPRGVPQPVDLGTLRMHPDLGHVLMEAADSARGAVEEEREKLVADEAKVRELSAELEQLQEELLDAGLLKVRADGKIINNKPRGKTASAEDTDGLTAEDVDRYRAAQGRTLMLQSQIGSRATAIEQLEDQALAAERVADSFEAWADRQRASFAWRLLERMRAAADRARGELASAEAVQPPTFEAGELVRLRKRFHRGLLVAALSTLIPLAIALLIPPLARALADRDDLTASQRAMADAIVQAVLEERYPQWWLLVIIGVGLLLIFMLFLCIAYYRGWSEFERRVLLAEHFHETSARRASALRIELQRLETVHEQAAEWLDTLGAALYHPWELHPEWLERGARDLDVERMPFAMHIAEALEESSGAAGRIRLSAAQSLLKPGWRNQAFVDLVDTVRDHLGLEQTRLSVDALDNDLPEASNNSRRRLRENMRGSELLERVAQRRLDTMVDHLQDGSLYEASTPVARLRSDPLAAFRARAGDREVDVVAWRDFLFHTLGTSGDAPTPLSPLGIAAHQVQAAHHQRVQTHVLAPERIAEDLQREVREEMTVHPYPPATAQSFDVVVRVDMVGPVPVDAIRLWSSGDAQREAPSRGEPACGRCGRMDCPGAGPRGVQACTYLGI